VSLSRNKLTNVMPVIKFVMVFARAGAHNNRISVQTIRHRL
jgi:hypothetical protein